MKVCTDSCLFGAWAAERVARTSPTPQGILDIGTGTGLLSLMMAQKNPGKIEAVEIDPESAGQARENFDNSPWKDRIHLFLSDIKHYNTTSRYDWIISNPPFFENDLRSPDEGINRARHNTGLEVDELLPIVSGLLAQSGSFSLLLPESRALRFENRAAEFGLFASRELKVRQSPKHPPFRSFLILQKEKQIRESSEMAITGIKGRYTPEFLELLRPYYLKL